jgi:hypothetical protein
MNYNPQGAHIRLIILKVHFNYAKISVVMKTKTFHYYSFVCQTLLTYSHDEVNFQYWLTG